MTAGSYVLLALLTGLTVAVEGWSTVDLVLCGLLAAGLLVRPPRLRFAGLLLITAILVVRAPWFGFFTPVAYVHAFRLRQWWWQIGGVGAVAVVAGMAQAYAVDTGDAAGIVTYGAVVAANVVPMCALAWFLRRGERQNADRERALDEAREANRRLAASLDENAALARDAAVRDERQRMAREIHDTLAQGLTGIISQLRAAEHAGDDPAGWRRHVAAATALARESLSEARRSVHALHPEPLRTARLSEALAAVAARWSALHEIPVRVTTTGTPHPVRPEAEAVLLRVAQEALANVARHAGATRVGLTLSYLEEEAAVDVRDDGCGFDPARSGGFGLIAMRERVEALSGTLLIESEPGGGTGISARVPAGLAEVDA